jgi:hypothetical protein
MKGQGLMPPRQSGTLEGISENHTRVTEQNPNTTVFDSNLEKPKAAHFMTVKELTPHLPALQRSRSY